MTRDRTGGVLPLRGNATRDRPRQGGHRRERRGEAALATRQHREVRDGPIVGQPDSYRYGEPGYDCSSFVSEMFKRATNGAINLTAYTNAAYDQCDWVKDPMSGAIVFYHYVDDQNINWPHMGLWLSKTEVLDARFGQGVGIHPHVTPIGPTSDGRYRRTMLPKGLATVVVNPPPVPSPDELVAARARIAELEAQVASLKLDLDDARSKLGVITVDYAQHMENLLIAIRALKPAA